MFGYIAINKAEMKFKDYDVYQAYYCGLCRRLKECYGKRGQLKLSYDMTFLIVLLTGLYEPKMILRQLCVIVSYIMLRSMVKSVTNIQIMQLP